MIVLIIFGFIGILCVVAFLVVFFLKILGGAYCRVTKNQPIVHASPEELERRRLEREQNKQAAIQAEMTARAIKNGGELTPYDEWMSKVRHK